ncbi:hypothetical protein DIPPA_70215 [Diplonema papillatum]|nr:hypothetical protein DIPPA_70215 [Diplonema papillatum]
MLCHPLGRHISKARSRKKACARKPSRTFVATVWLCWDVRCSSSLAGRQTLVTLGNDVTTADALAQIYASKLPAPGPDAPAVLPLGAYTLLQTYADGDIDIDQPFLAHNRGLRQQLAFPYLLALCPNPFAIKLEALQRREGAARAASAGRGLGWLSAFAAPYMALLRDCGRRYAGLILVKVPREAEKLAIQQAYDRLSILEDALSVDEGCRRLGIAEREAATWQFHAAAARVYHLAETGAREFEEERRAWLREAEAAAAAEEAAIQQRCRLRRAVAGQLTDIRKAFDASLATRRMLYNASRIASTVSEAARAGVPPFTSHEARLQIYRAPLPCAAGQADAADPDVLLADFYTSSWPKCRGKHLVPFCGVATLKPHLQPRAQRSVAFAKW